MASVDAHQVWTIMAVMVLAVFASFPVFLRLGRERTLPPPPKLTRHRPRRPRERILD